MATNSTPVFGGRATQPAPNYWMTQESVHEAVTLPPKLVDEPLTLPTSKKDALIAFFINQGAIHYYKELLREFPQSEVYVFYLSDATIESEDVKKGHDLFLRLMRRFSKLAKFVIADFDKHFKKPLKKVVVSHYSHGKLVERDCQGMRDDCFVSCSINNYAPRNRNANRSSPLVVKCPKSKCAGHGKNVWRCYHCKDIVYYGFDEMFYCSCGAQDVSLYKFRCNQDTHGYVFEQSHLDVKFFLKDLVRRSQVNILILGETGVGKSTWINSVSNYLRHETITKAATGELHCLVPSSFSITDSNHEEVIVSTGNSKNENFKAGQSATQETVIHTFKANGQGVRLIDTPGIGDVRGVLTDVDNMKNIMKTIKDVGDIHGIVILLKPNNARLGLAFRFCIQELLSNLNKSAVNNIVFGFTNSRNTFYRPGDTLPALHEVLELVEKSSKVKFELTRDRIYCFESESFRFLAALKRGVKFDDSSCQTFGESWEHSANEAFRMFGHFNSCQAHSSTLISELADVRNRLNTLLESKAPLKNIIDQERKVIADLNKECVENQEKLDNMKTLLMMPTTKYEVKLLTAPRLVCSGPSCVEYPLVNGSKKARYLRVCQDPCHANVQLDTINSAGLSQIGAPFDHLGKCSGCGHSYEMHLKVQSHVEASSGVVEDPGIKMNIAALETMLIAKKDRIKKLENTIQAKEPELYVFDAQASIFVKVITAQAILPINDAKLEYINHMIKEETQKTQTGNSLVTLYKLETARSIFNDEVSLFAKEAQATTYFAEKELNILILGETGVGKSTWINGLVNYLDCNNLGEAEVSELITLIPTSFTITDDDYNAINVTTGSDTNEDQQDGHSATQTSVIYPFHVGETLIRVIDTPGIGDVRGFEQDKKNLDNILSTLSQIDELHAIVILLKPNNARLTLMFRFCIEQLLSHLHKSAVSNIIFGFTNTRGTFYLPGDTFPALQLLLQQKPNVSIPLNQDTIFCFDSESYRFLAAVKNGVVFSDEDRKIFAESWTRSVRETRRLFARVAELTPHRITNTTSMNAARTLIVQLTKPMVDIARNIERNIEALAEQIQDVKATRKLGKELEATLKVPVIELVTIQFAKPRTVCAHPDCVEYSDVQGQKVTHYKTVCHDPCHLTDVKINQLNPRNMDSCVAFSGRNCRECRHKVTDHLHITSETKEILRDDEDKNLRAKIKFYETDADKKQAYVDNAQFLLGEYEGEQKEVEATAAIFGAFLKVNAIIPASDDRLEYLDHLIKEENGKIRAGGKLKMLAALQHMRDAYAKEVNVIEKAMRSGSFADTINPSTISNSVDRLYGLKHFGKALQNIKDGLTTAYKTHCSNVTKVVVPKAPEKKSKKGYLSWFK